MSDEPHDCKAECCFRETARQFSADADFYRNLVERCGRALGDLAYRADDGSRPGGILCAKVPELVEDLVRDRDGWLEQHRKREEECWGMAAEIGSATWAQRKAERSLEFTQDRVKHLEAKLARVNALLSAWQEEPADNHEAFDVMWHRENALREALR